MSAPYCVITGASGGIGLATAIELARRGWRLRIVGRSADKLAAARRQLESLSGDVATFQADFSALTEVRKLAEALLGRDEPLHVLINNAGVWHPTFQRSADGFEDTFAVNHLAPFLLTHLLLPRMRDTPGDRRIVHVSSRLHLQAGQMDTLLGRAVHAVNVLGVPVGASRARMDLEAIDRVAPFDGLEAYARSKLAQVIFSCELARRERHVTSNAVHPGSVQTDVTRESGWLGLLDPLARLLLDTPAQGARTSVWAATEPSIARVSGSYFASSRPARAATIVEDVEVARRLWELSCQRVGLPVT